MLIILFCFLLKKDEHQEYLDVVYTSGFFGPHAPIALGSTVWNIFSNFVFVNFLLAKRGNHFESTFQHCLCFINEIHRS